MGKKPSYRKVDRIIKELAKELNKTVPLEKVILFGSFAKGKVHPDSDLDLVFISPEFKGRDSFSRFRLIARARKNYELPMDYFGFTPEEFEKASPLATLGEIRETGKIVFP